VAVILDVFVFLLCAFILRYFHKTIVRERATEGAKNEFLSLASHQLRTPATSVKQYLGMVTGGYFGKLTPEQEEALTIAYQSNESEITIINNLLNIAKLNLEKIQINKKSVIVSTLVREVADEYTPQVAAAEQTLTFTNKLKQHKALLDATYFKTVVENLVDNAIKYSPARAKIRLDLRLAPPPKLPKKGVPSFQLTISDNGMGIKKRDLGKLFKKFSRVPGAATEAVDGSGLGLYWVKQIVERHGGHVSVSSRERSGTKFVVTIPLGVVAKHAPRAK
jgi:signal transduction histidine kinase